MCFPSFPFPWRKGNFSNLGETLPSPLSSLLFPLSPSQERRTTDTPDSPDQESWVAIGQRRVTTFRDHLPRTFCIQVWLRHLSTHSGGGMREQEPQTSNIRGGLVRSLMWALLARVPRNQFSSLCLRSMPHWLLAPTLLTMQKPLFPAAAFHGLEHPCILQTPCLWPQFLQTTGVAGLNYPQPWASLLSIPSLSGCMCPSVWTGYVNTAPGLPILTLHLISFLGLDVTS